ncbi:MAG: hypothetical protein K9J13_06230 [Saprospiraceae bacterium]|nr:hypothetical protein [Saprospiraceae bacterium]
MKNTPIPRKFLMIILFFIIIVVYGNLFFNVNKTLAKTASLDRDIPKTTAIKEKEASFIDFNGNFSDPFALKEIPKPQPVKEKRSESKEKALIIDLQGIVGKTAILKYQDNLYFVQKGDTLSYLTICEVTQNFIILQFHNILDTLFVQNNLNLKEVE